MNPRRILFIFVDGLGIGSLDPLVNFIHSGCCPFLEKGMDEYSVPIDAQLGVAGLPQSATGQTALLTGINAPKALGRHVEGFPNEKLRQIIKKENIFKKMTIFGALVTFANAYFVENIDLALKTWRKPLSVTSVSALSGIGEVRTKEKLLSNEAVYHDLTREGLRDRGYDGPLISPEKAAENLISIAEKHHFTLFEFFQSDFFAHRGTDDDVRAILCKLDRFLAVLASFADQKEHLLVLSSDHGNIEDRTTSTHTSNPVPFMVLGEGAFLVKQQVKQLTDVTPALLAWWEKGM